MGGLRPGRQQVERDGRHRPSAEQPGPVAEVMASIDGEVVEQRALRLLAASDSAAAPPGLSPMDTQHGAPSCAS